MTLQDSTSRGEPPPAQPLEWCREAFDYNSWALAQNLHETMTQMREKCPVVHSDLHEGYWVVTRYDDVARVCRSWTEFTASEGISVPRDDLARMVLPLASDPPIQKAYRRILNPYFAPAVVQRFEGLIRSHIHAMIDSFIERGECEFMDEFARPLPGRIFFEEFLSTPPDEAHHVHQLAVKSITPSDPDVEQARLSLFNWVVDFIARRREEPSKGDVVDAVLGGEVDGRPLTESEVQGLMVLLVLGGLDTTSNALGGFVLRFALNPEILDYLRAEPDHIDAALEELMRLDGPVIAMARSATRDIELSGTTIPGGDAVLFYFAAANRDPDKFENPDEFRLDRDHNRHLSFGVGPHRCAGSNLARMNLRLSIEAIAQRLHNLRLAVDPGEVRYYSYSTRGPISVPITFTPGPRLTV